LATGPLEETRMGDEQSCGKGLAENAALPAALGAVTAAMAHVLELHMRALDLEDPNAAKEHEAYGKLVRDQRAAAAQLQTTARAMTGYRDLPMGQHDMAVMSDARSVAAFESFVQTKAELLALLQKTKEGDERMLAAMRGAAAGGVRRTDR
jgi:hypothetical protein